jgi:hypothetical protein
MITIPYTYLVIAFFLVLGFTKMGQMDEEIGWVLGLSGGFFVLILNHYWPGRYWGLALHAVVVFALLTAYKIVRGLWENRPPEE